MDAEQQRRLMEAGVAWQKVDGRTLDAAAEASLRRRFILARLEVALNQMHDLALETGFVLVPTGHAGRDEDGWVQVSMGLKQAGHDYGSDAEQSLSFVLTEVGRVRAERMIVTRHRGDDFKYVPSIVEADVGYDEATVSWFIDRMLDFMEQKVANPRPSGLPLQEAIKAPQGRPYYYRQGRVMTLGWTTTPAKP